MPTVFREGPYRRFFYPSDRDEPPHVHVRRGEDTAKFWLSPVRLAQNTGFRGADVRQIYQLVERYETALLEAWNEYFHR